MLDFLTSWTGVLLGGGVAASIVLLICLYLVGGQKIVELFTDVARPALTAMGNMLGEWVALGWANFRDGMAVIATSVKALFALAVCCAVVAASVYYPTKAKTEKKVWEHAHRNYTLLPKRRVAAKPKASSDLWAPVRKSMGGN